MGNSTLNQLAASPTQTPATPEQYNALVQALEGNIVMRETTGVEVDNKYNIGEPAAGRPANLYVGNAIYLNGQPITPPVLSGTAINSGAAAADGFPAFLSPAGGAGNTVSVLGATTPLSVVIDSAGFSLSVNLTSPALTLAPGSNNTCTINDSLLGVQNARTVGEFGYFITISAVGSAITALNGKVAVFKVGAGPEVFLATVDTSNNRLIPIYRGIGGTVQDILTNGGTITLLKAAWLFLSNDMLTITPTYNYPTWSATAPGSPAVGDYWWDVANKTWKTYNGSSWVQAHAIYLGMAISDSVGCKWAEPEDFNIAWNGQIQFKDMVSATDAGGIVNVHGPVIVSVAGVMVTLSSDFSINFSVTTQGWYYLYIDKFGNITTNNTPPRTKKNRLGYYMPGTYKRLIGAFYCILGTGFSNLQINSDGYIDADSTDTFNKIETITTPTDAIVQFSAFCPIADTHEIHTIATVNTAGNVYGYIKNLYPASLPCKNGYVDSYNPHPTNPLITLSHTATNLIKSGFYNRSCTGNTFSINVVIQRYKVML